MAGEMCRKGRGTTTSTDCCARYRSTCDVQADVGGSTGPCVRETPPSLLQLFAPHIIDAVRAEYIFLVVSVSFFLESCYFSHRSEK